MEAENTSWVLYSFLSVARVSKEKESHDSCRSHMTSQVMKLQELEHQKPNPNKTKTKTSRKISIHESPVSKWTRCGNFHSTFNLGPAPNTKAQINILPFKSSSKYMVLKKKEMTPKS